MTGGPFLPKKDNALYSNLHVPWIKDTRLETLSVLSLSGSIKGSLRILYPCPLSD